MKRINHVIRWVILTCAVMSHLHPVSAFYSYGARSVGMGGAFTGMTNDASVFYWNPGGLTLLPGWVIEMQYGQDSVFTEGSRSSIDSMNKWFDEGDAGVADLTREMTRMAEKEWLFRGGDTMSFVIANQKMAFFFNQTKVYYLQHDKTGVDLDIDPSGRDENGDWRYEMSGINIREYGMSVTLLGGSGSFSLGLTGKYIDAKAYHSTPDFRLVQTSEPDSLFDRIESGDTRSSSTWGLDAGMVMVFGTNRLGISARNIRKYELEIDDDYSITIKPEYRIGYTYQPTQRFVFGMDYNIGKEFDLLGNRLEGSEMAAGFEGVFGEKRWLILRSGVSMPLAGDAPMIFSLGSGLAFDSGVLDIGYAFDKDQDSKKLWFGLRFMF